MSTDSNTTIPIAGWLFIANSRGRVVVQRDAPRFVAADPLVKRADALAAISALQREVEDLRKVLERIAYPIKWEQEHLPDGHELNWQMLVHMLDKPDYYQRAARAALGTSKAEVPNV